MIVPLKVQAGCSAWSPGSPGDGGRRFTADDLAFGEDLAHRAALAIDTAQLHSRLRDVATRLQRAVLPAELPVLPGWETAASYLPGRAQRRRRGLLRRDAARRAGSRCSSAT